MAVLLGAIRKISKKRLLQEKVFKDFLDNSNYISLADIRKRLIDLSKTYEKDSREYEHAIESIKYIESKLRK